jgi:ribosomal protein L11 methylase PrmA
MAHKRTNPINAHSRHVVKPYDWDYPSQGLRFPRTLGEAFGPGDHLTTKSSITQTHVAYGIAVIIVVVTLLMLITDAP